MDAKSYSLLGRLGIGLTISLVVLFVVQWWLVSVIVKKVSEDYIISRLVHDADALLIALTVLPDGHLELDSKRIDAIYHQPFSGHYFQISSGSQLIRSRSLWDQTLKPPRNLDGTLHFIGPQAQPLLAMRYKYTKHKTPIELVIAEDLTPLHQGMGYFEMRYAAVSLLLLFIIMSVQVWVVRRSLKPLDQVREDIKHLETGDATQVCEKGVPREIQPLVLEFNRLLDVMQQRLSRSRTALGNLAHSLKTPLTVLSRLTDSEELEGCAKTRAQLDQQTTKIRQLLDYQLKRARLAGSSAPGWQFRLNEELQPLADTLQHMYADKHLSIELNIPDDKVFSGDREDLLELFGNLLDNACKWAKHRVLLSVNASAGLVFVIEDDGPGCPAEKCHELLRRGKRLDESSLGHGLGLAIVKDIVEQYQGTIHLGKSPLLGGFQVSVAL